VARNAVAATAAEAAGRCRFVDSHDQKAADEMRRRYSDPECSDVTGGYWDDPEETDAPAADWNRASEPVSERCAAVACEVIDKGLERPRMRPVEVICLLLRAPRRDYLSRHT
jgi:hypothetical protein